MARASYSRAASALLAVGLAAFVSTACGSPGLLGDEPAPAGPPRPAGETQVITVELGQKDGRLNSAVRTKRPGEDPDLQDTRPDVGRRPTPGPSDTAGTIPAWEHWPAPALLAPSSKTTGAATEPAVAGTAPRRPAAGVPPPPPARPVGAARPANARPAGAPAQPAGEPASREATQ